MRGNCLIAQSGGPTAVINNSLCGILTQAKESGAVQEIYGARRGIYGMLHGDYVGLSGLPATKVNSLRCSPGAALGSWRYKLQDSDVEQIVLQMRRHDIRSFFYIGGNGSMRAAHIIDAAAKRIGYDLQVIGIPKTVDNDLVLTDHSPGYGSAAKFIATCVLDIAMDIRSQPRSKKVTIVETMGRNTGWLAAASSLVTRSEAAVPLLIYIPESVFSLERFLQDITASYEQNGSVLAVVSEGIRDRSGRLLAEDSLAQDPVGRPQLGGVSTYLAQKVNQHTSLNARNVLPGIWQRSGMLISSKRDADEAYQAGKVALRWALEGRSGVMVALHRIRNFPYEVSYEQVLLEDVAGREQAFPIEWYNEQTCKVTEGFHHYLEPLIQGEMFVPMNNGLPVYETI
ncbi:6-phosphofructokinase [Brevibacillus sp. NRS-1366]|uniref:6-phosphofructokinase n=1 Tax=Brevibacillus sp. NRS-1366 TaxID=3233899 RepID=UPI003D263419